MMLRFSSNASRSSNLELLIITAVIGNHNFVISRISVVKITTKITLLYWWLV